MLKVKIGSTWIESQGLEIPVTLKSPLPFEGKRVSGSYIFNFSIPYTDALKKEAKYIHRPSSNNLKPGKLPFYIEQGPLKFTGECTLIYVDENTLEISALINTGVLAALLKETNMTDVDMGGVRLEDDLDVVNAKMASSLTYIIGQGEPAPFTQEDPVAFDYIIKDTYSNMHASGLSFTCSQAGMYMFTYTLDFLILSSISEFRTWLNSSLVDAKIITLNNNIVVFSVALNVGDVVQWSLYLESYGVYEYIINCDLRSGSQMEIFRQSSAFNSAANNLYPDSDYAVFPLHNAKIFDNLPDDVFMLDHHSIKELYENYFPIANYYNNGSFPALMKGTANGEVFSAYNLFVPFPYLAYFITRMAAHLGITITDNSFASVDLRQLVIYNAFAENEYIFSNLAKISNGFDLKNHVPEEKLSDFLSDVCALLGIAFDYDSYKRNIRFKSLDEIVKSRAFTTFPGIVTEAMALKIAYWRGYKLTQEIGSDAYAKEDYKALDDLTYKGELLTVNLLGGITDMKINDCYFITTRKEYWYYNYDEEFAELNWMFYSNEFRHVVKSIDENADGEVFEVKTKWAACMNSAWDNSLDTQLSGDGTRRWLIPYVEDPGQFEGMPPQFAGKFSKYLTFYRGKQPDWPNLNLYPMGSNDVYNYAGEKITGANLSLRWDGEYGLWKQRHKAWVEWAINQKGRFTTKAYLTPHQLSEIDFFRWYRINSNDILIAEMRFNITEYDVSQVEIDLYIR